MHRSPGPKKRADQYHFHRILLPRPKEPPQERQRLADRGIIYAKHARTVRKPIQARGEKTRRVRITPR